MDGVERLEAVEEIKQLKARYFRCMDTKDWAGFESLFSSDAVMDMSGEGRDGRTDTSNVPHGAEAIAAFVKGAVHDVVTVHHGHMPEIELTSDTTASGIWAMEDKLRWPEGAPIKWMHGYGHYHDTYERIGGQWLIKTTTLTRLRVDAEMA